MDDTCPRALAASVDRAVPAASCILPHGALLVCDPITLELRHVSTNLADLTGMAANPFPGQPLAAIIGHQAVHELRNAAARAGAGHRPGFVTGLRLPDRDSVLDATIHTQADHCFVELEPAGDGATAAGPLLDLTRQLVGRIGGDESAAWLSTTGARLMQAMLGYDRVMVCRLRPDGGGEVLAEARSSQASGQSDADPALVDLTWIAESLCPASPIRMLVNLHDDPVPLAPAPEAGAVDMSYVHLRAAPQAYIDRLRETDAVAVLSIPLIANGKVWGAILCHHHAPRATPLPLRIAADLFARFLAVQMLSAERREAAIVEDERRQKLESLTAGLDRTEAFAALMADRLPALADLLECDGAVWRSRGNLTFSGTALSEESCARATDMVRALGAQAVWQDDAGILAIPVSSSGEDVLLMLRTLGREWSSDDLALAGTLRSRLRDIVLRQNEADAQEKQHAERRQRLVNDELNHRVKNLLSVVKSIVRQTAAGARTVAHYAGTLDGRLHALALAHDRSLDDCGGSLPELVEIEASLYRSSDDPDRVTADGPDLWLDDKAYGVMALSLHEMMTNAAKYGALSTPEGRLGISWLVNPDGGVVIDWRESGGPRVAQPDRKGFGSRMIRSSVEYDLKGQVEIGFDPTGLAARFVIPAGHVIAGVSSETRTRRKHRPAEDLRGLSVLVLEDQGLVALDAEDILRRMGASDIRLASGVANAMEVLDGFDPDVALLDFKLGNETAEEVAHALIARHLPFMFMTGYSDRVMLPADLRHIPVIRKPVSEIDIARHISAARAAMVKPAA